MERNSPSDSTKIVSKGEVLPVSPDPGKHERISNMHTIYTRVFTGVFEAYRHVINPRTLRLPISVAETEYNEWLSQQFTSSTGYCQEKGDRAVRVCVSSAINGYGAAVPIGPKMTSLVHAHHALEALAALRQPARQRASASRILSEALEIDSILMGLQ